MHETTRVRGYISIHNGKTRILFALLRYLPMQLEISRYPLLCLFGRPDVRNDSLLSLVWWNVMIALLRVFLRFAVRFSSRYEVVVLYVILYYYVGFSYEIAKQDFYYCFLLASRSNKKKPKNRWSSSTFIALGFFTILFGTVKYKGWVVYGLGKPKRKCEKMSLRKMCRLWKNRSRSILRYACIALFSSIFRTDCLKNEAMLGKREFQFVIFINFWLQ